MHLLLAFNKNLVLFYLFKLSSSLLFILPVIYVFFISIGFTYQQIFILEAIYAVSILLFEVPTGAVADYFGRKASLIAGCILCSVSCFLFILHNEFIYFCIIYLLFAVGMTFLSGADSAFLYDILLKAGKEKEFTKYKGVSNMLEILGIGAASVIGGHLSEQTYKDPFIVTSCTLLVSMILLLLTTEAASDKKETKKYFQIIRKSFVIIISSKRIIWFMAFYSVVSLLFKIIHPLSQIYMKSFDVQTVKFGYVLAFYCLAGAVAAKLCNKIEKMLSSSIFIVIFGFGLTSVVFPLIFFRGTSSLFFSFAFIAMAMTSVIINSKIIKSIPTSLSSTILSVNNMTRQLFIAIMLPFIGRSLDIVPLKSSLFGLLILLFILLPILFLPYLPIFIKGKNISSH